MARRRIFWPALSIAGLLAAGAAQGGVVFGNNVGSLHGGVYRWDAAPRTISGNERSLDGGLRYALSGGSFEAFRNQFAWNALPSVADFTASVQSAFAAWTSTDPVSGLGTSLRFVYDPNTAVAGLAGGGGVNINGAEIDLIATNDARFWDPGDTGTQGETWFNGINATVTLTSGVANYVDSRAISGADLYLNNNPGAVYSLDFFRRLLTHELGHALGFGDVENEINPGQFIDDNFDAGNPVATLNNSWANLVNPRDPSGSAGLSIYTIGDGTTQLAGVDLLMESWGLGRGPGNPETKLVPLTNDEYGIRQFLYPVPEPASSMLTTVALLGLAASRRRRTIAR